jgi:hypothetical protein
MSNQLQPLASHRPICGPEVIGFALAAELDVAAVGAQAESAPQAAAAASAAKTLLVLAICPPSLCIRRNSAFFAPQRQPLGERGA